MSRLIAQTNSIPAPRKHKGEVLSAAKGKVLSLALSGAEGTAKGGETLSISPPG